MANAKDLYMNFKSAEGQYDAANSTTLVEEEIETRMSPRGDFCWLIHLLEWWIPTPIGTTPSLPRAALNSQPELAAMPTLVTKGTVGFVEAFSDCDTSGGQSQILPHRQPYLPPIPYAAATMSLYLASAVNSVEVQSKNGRVRIGFTTQDLDAAMYAEIGEVWAW